MKILVIGNGGREHALAWKASQSPMVEIVFVAPGNAGTMLESALRNIAIKSTDIQSLLKFAKQEHIDLTIVGPEAPLVLGIVDIFLDAGLKILGPTQASSKLEASKTFAKEFLSKYNIPTGKYQSFIDVKTALSFLHKQELPIVIKADGLSAGKGVVIATTLKEAETAVLNMLTNNTLGEAGHRIIIEEYVHGEEASFIVIVDGENILPMVTSQDYKRVGDKDTGPNTGGMGAYSPAPVITTEIHKSIMDQILWPTIRGMKIEGTPYTGVLYVGLMVDNNSQPKVIEFNCRFGDPETQSIMMRLQSDLITLCLSATRGQLNCQTLHWDQRPALSVILATTGYPGYYKIGEQIHGLPLLNTNDIKIFHSGTIMKDNTIVTNGGRVLCVTALGDDIASARKNAYEVADNIFWKGKFCRRDIGYRAIPFNKIIKPID